MFKSLRFSVVVIDLGHHTEEKEIIVCWTSIAKVQENHVAWLQSTELVLGGEASFSVRVPLKDVTHFSGDIPWFLLRGATQVFVKRLAADDVRYGFQAANVPLKGVGTRAKA